MIREVNAAIFLSLAIICTAVVVAVTLAVSIAISVIRAALRAALIVARAIIVGSMCVACVLSAAILALASAAGGGAS